MDSLQQLGGRERNKDETASKRWRKKGRKEEKIKRKSKQKWTEKLSSGQCVCVCVCVCVLCLLWPSPLGAYTVTEEDTLGTHWTARNASLVVMGDNLAQQVHHHQQHKLPNKNATKMNDGHWKEEEGSQEEREPACDGCLRWDVDDDDDDDGDDDGADDEHCWAQHW